MASTTQMTVECRLRPHARLLLRIATVMAFIGMKLPYSWIVAVSNRSWQMRLGSGEWFNIRIDDTGRRIA